jgi:hypothetical protein
MGMRWTKVRTTWLGTSLEKLDRWHGLPVSIRGYSTTGTTARGWGVVILVAVLLVAIILIEDLLL